LPILATFYEFKITFWKKLVEGAAITYFQCDIFWIYMLWAIQNQLHCFASTFGSTSLSAWCVIGMASCSSLRAFALLLCQVPKSMTICWQLRNESRVLWWLQLQNGASKTMAARQRKLMIFSSRLVATIRYLAWPRPVLLWTNSVFSLPRPPSSKFWNKT
jgi:hypothetical protein